MKKIMDKAAKLGDSMKSYPDYGDEWNKAMVAPIAERKPHDEL